MLYVDADRFEEQKQYPDEPLVIHRHSQSSDSRGLLVFVHGLGGKRYQTWGNFPKFLYEDVPDLDIGLYWYRTGHYRIRFSASIELNREAEVLADELRDSAGNYKFITLIGHSMGGLLVKAAIKNLIDRAEQETLLRIKGLFLIAAPQAGSLRVPRFLAWITKDARALQPHGRLVTEIEKTFIDRVTYAKSAGDDRFVIPTWIVSSPEDWWVDQLSAGLTVPSPWRRTVRGSHTRTVKPAHKKQGTYDWVLTRIRLDLLQPLLLEEDAAGRAAHALAQGEEIAAARQRVAVRARADSGESTCRIAGLRPQGLSEHFQDRVKVAEVLTETLLASGDFRAVVVVGRGGIGKTALACEVMAPLERDERVDGIVYLGTRSTGIDLRTIYFEAGRLSGGEERRRLELMWSDAPESAQRNVLQLLERLRGRYIILMDNLEDLLGPDGRLRDEELCLFFRLFLASIHGARMLVTTREEPVLPSEVLKYRVVVDLDHGLDAADAAKLLHDLDHNGDVGLRDADPDTLREIHKRTGGDPKRLESVFALLSYDRTLLPKLLADSSLWEREVTENLVRMAYDGLDQGNRLVMQALAVFDHPVPEAALSWVLERDLRGAELHARVLRLWRTRFVNIQRKTGDIDLHRIDREYTYAQIPRDASAMCNLRELEQRAAGYYRRLRLGHEEWSSPGALEPQMSEFQHLVRAEDYDEAAAVLSEIDTKYMIWSGHARRVHELRKVLEGRIRDPRLQMLHYNAMGQTRMILGPFEATVADFEHGLRLADELSDLRVKAEMLRCLGETYRVSGRLEEAASTLLVALQISREVGDQAGEGLCLFHLGLTLAYAGRLREALTYTEQHLATAERSGDRVSLARPHNVFALTYVALGKATQAIYHARRWLEALATAQMEADEWSSLELNATAPYVRNVLGMAYLQLGRDKDAEMEFQRVIASAREVSERRPEGFALFNQARIYRRRGEADAAVELAELSAGALEKLSPAAAAAASALAEAVRAALIQDGRGEAEALLRCAESAQDLPDLYDPIELVLQAETLAEDGNWPDLAERSRALAGALAARRHAEGNDRSAH